jgi:hypothetical protein
VLYTCVVIFLPSHLIYSYILFLISLLVSLLLPTLLPSFSPLPLSPSSLSSFLQLSSHISYLPYFTSSLPLFLTSLPLFLTSLFLFSPSLSPLLLFLPFSSPFNITSFLFPYFPIQFSVFSDFRRWHFTNLQNVCMAV